MSSNKDKKAKYFCENCGSEVAANARFCPKCGKFFSSVRCPSCGHMGTVHDFKNGCPKCHYAMSEEEINGEEPAATENAGHKRKKKGKKPNASVSSDTPEWLFICSIVVLIGIIAFIFCRCQ